IRSHVLKLGMALRCSECRHTGWFSLEDLKPRMACPHCLRRFTFPAGSPPNRNQWAYRVIGPFTTGGFAGGAYCVGAALNFLMENEEIEGLSRNAKRGRRRMDIGKQINPVHVLTARELFSEFKLSDFYSLYGDNADYARGVYLRDDIQELCDFTQRIYLGMPSY